VSVALAPTLSTTRSCSFPSCSAMASAILLAMGSTWSSARPVDSVVANRESLLTMATLGVPCAIAARDIGKKVKDNLSQQSILLQPRGVAALALIARSSKAAAAERMSMRPTDEEWATLKTEHWTTEWKKHARLIVDRHATCIFATVVGSVLLLSVVSLGLATLALYRVDESALDEQLREGAAVLKLFAEFSKEWPAIAEGLSNASVARLKHLQETVQNASVAVDSVARWEPNPITVNFG
jgi:hypothetical protein